VLGHKEVPGKPALYGTTKTFLDHFNLKSINELPTLSEIADLENQAAKLAVQLELAPPITILDTEIPNE
jgi:segregation and condensation protein B